MSNLNTILSEVETSAAKLKTLEGELAAERAHAKALVKQYRTQSDEVFKVLGIAENRKERKPRTPNATLMNVATRTIRQTVKAGEKNPKTVLNAATDAAMEVAKTQLGLSELPAEIKKRIDKRVKSAVAK